MQLFDVLSNFRVAGKQKSIPEHILLRFVFVFKFCRRKKIRQLLNS